MNREYAVYETLLKVYRGGFSTIELDRLLSAVADERDRAYMSRLFYGVLETDGALSYALGALCDKPPKPAVAVLIKMGMYMLTYMRTPDYAVLKKVVDLAKKAGKGGVSGFVNAVLRRYTAFVYPERGEVTDSVYLSVRSGVSVWLADKLIGQYGYDFAYAMLTARPYAGTHIRHNARRLSRDEFEKKLKETDDFHPDSRNFGYYVTHNTMKNLDARDFTPQSLSSMVAVERYLAAYGRTDGAVLDVCAAPGGKSVYLSERGAFDITACDVHPHRVKLIESYAARMGAPVRAVRNDGTVGHPDWQGAFDLVICDVPCSGIGVISAKPDIALRRTEEDIRALAELQLSILRTSAAYTAENGVLCYSTCTVLREENEDVVDAFLRDGTFVLTGPALHLYPQDGLDGFYVATFRRKSR